MGAMKYRRSFTEVEAIQWDGTAQTFDEIRTWVAGHGAHAVLGGTYGDRPPFPRVRVENRTTILMYAPLNSWLTYEPGYHSYGNFFAYAPAVFASNWEPVTAEGTGPSDEADLAQWLTSQAKHAVIIDPDSTAWQKIAWMSDAWSAVNTRMVLPSRQLATRCTARGGDPVRLVWTP